MGFFHVGYLVRDGTIDSTRKGFSETAHQGCIGMAGSDALQKPVAAEMACKASRLSLA